MKLLCELNEELEVISEANEGKKEYWVKGVFIESNIKNRNGRVYPLEVVQKEVANYTKNFIERRRAFGELGHPSNPTINLDKVSHLITELKQDGTRYIGKAKILDTANGKIVKALMDEGCILGMSTRALGSVREMNGSKIVQSDFMLCTAGDIVADPSAPNAFMENLNENKEWIFEAGVWREKEIEIAKKVVRNVSKADIEKTISKLFENFVNGLAP